MGADKQMTPSEHAASVLWTYREQIPSGFRDEDGVWHDGPHRIVYEAALETLRAQAERVTELETALRELDDWVSRMPDAGFNQDSPRWDWWHQRPRIALKDRLETP